MIYSNETQKDHTVKLKKNFFPTYLVIKLLHWIFNESNSTFSQKPSRGHSQTTFTTRVGGFTKCQLYLISLFIKTVNQGGWVGKKRSKMCKRSL